MIGSSHCLLLLRLVGVIALVLVFRQSFENRSITEIVVIVGFILHGRMPWMHPKTNLSTVCIYASLTSLHVLFLLQVLGLLEFQAKVLVKPEVLNLLRLLSLLEVLGPLEVLSLLEVLDLLKVLVLNSRFLGYSRFLAKLKEYFC